MEINRKSLYAIIVKSGIAGIIFLLGIWVMTLLTAPKHLHISDRYIQTERKGGQTEYTVQIPGHAKQGPYSLIFKSKGNAITVDAEGTVLYAYGQYFAEEGKDVGRIHVSAGLPDNAKEVKIRLEAEDADADPVLYRIDLCQTKDIAAYFLTNDTLGFPLAMFYIVIGVCFITASVIVLGKWELSRLGILLGMVLLCLSVELLDTGGHYLVLGIEPHFWNLLFYVDSYIVSGICMLFSLELVKEKLSRPEKWVMHTGIAIQFLCAAAVFGLVRFTRLRFCDLSSVFSASIILCGLFSAYGIFRVFRKKNIIKHGVLFITFLVAWLFLAIILRFSTAPLMNFSDLPVIDFETIGGMLIFYAAMLSFLKEIERSIEDKKQKKEQIGMLETKLKESRIKNFTRQMQPHFLYNTLSSIQEIILDNPDYAYQLLGDFTIFLRGCIRSMSDEQPVPFSQELRNIKAFVAIEKMRFEERLTVYYEIKEENFMIVPLSIQPLVENAIRHGIYDRGPQGGTVWIRSFREADAYVVQVEDTGIGFDTENMMARFRDGSTDSYGIRNLIYRLETGMKATIRFDSEIGRGTLVTVRIPAENGEVVKA